MDTASNSDLSFYNPSVFENFSAPRIAPGILHLEMTPQALMHVFDRVKPDAFVIMGVSEHIGAAEYMDAEKDRPMPYNRENWELSAQWILAQDENNEWYIESGCYKNSFSLTSCYMAAGYDKDLLFNGKVGIGIKGGAIGGYQRVTEQEISFFPLPYLRLGKRWKPHAEIGFIPGHNDGEGYYCEGQGFIELDEAECESPQIIKDPKAVVTFSLTFPLE